MKALIFAGFVVLCLYTKEIEGMEGIQLRKSNRCLGEGAKCGQKLGACCTGLACKKNYGSKTCTAIQVETNAASIEGGNSKERNVKLVKTEKRFKKKDKMEKIKTLIEITKIDVGEELGANSCLFTFRSFCIRSFHTEHVAIDPATCKQNGAYCFLGEGGYPCCDPESACRQNIYGNGQDGFCVPKQTNGTDYCKASGKYCCKNWDCYPCCDPKYFCKLQYDLGSVVEREGKCVPYDASDLSNCKKDKEEGCDKPDQNACCNGLICVNHRGYRFCAAAPS